MSSVEASLAEPPASPADHRYPRPQLRRAGWQSLDGPWRFCFDDTRRFTVPAHVEGAWSHTIEVPFAPESARSGIGDTGFHAACWYEREFEPPPESQDGHVLLHFGAVDYEAQVWVNGRRVGAHTGGHTPFSFDVTDVLAPDGPQRVTVLAEDDPHDLAKPRGKQDWQREPHSIWYPRTTGIWQTVWVERVPDVYVHRVRWTPRLDRYEIGFEAALGGRKEPGLRVRLRLTVGDRVLADDTYSVVDGDGRPAHRPLGPRHRRLPQRAALEPRVADADPGRDRAAARRRRGGPGRVVHGTPERGRPRRPVRPQRPAVLPAPGPRPGLLAGLAS